MIDSKCIMTKDLLKTHPDENIVHAYRLMMAKDIRHLPVFDTDHKLVGILSNRDAQRALGLALTAQKKVSDFMSWPVFTVSESTPITIVIEEMMQKKVSALLVQNEQFDYIGIITTEDVLKCFQNTISREKDLKDQPLSFFMPNILF